MKEPRFGGVCVIAGTAIGERILRGHFDCHTACGYGATKFRWEGFLPAPVDSSTTPKWFSGFDSRWADIWLVFATLRLDRVTHRPYRTAILKVENCFQVLCLLEGAESLVSSWVMSPVPKKF